jgi:hypothetical protein
MTFTNLDSGHGILDQFKCGTYGSSIDVSEFIGSFKNYILSYISILEPPTTSSLGIRPILCRLLTGPFVLPAPASVRVGG